MNQKSPKKSTKRPSAHKVDLDRFSFLGPEGFWEALFWNINGMRALRFPLVSKQSPTVGNIAFSFKHLFVRSKQDSANWMLVRLADMLGLSENKNLGLLVEAGKKSTQHLRLLVLIYLAVGLGLLGLLAFLYQSSPLSFDIEAGGQRRDAALIVGIVNILFSLLAVYVTLFSAIRISLFIADRQYLETIALVLVFYILVELQQDDVLSISWKKSRLLERVDYLARKVVLMGFNRSSSDPTTKEWIQQHFKAIERYIREREKWVVAPQRNTLQILREDFYEIARLFIYGNYGALDWQHSVTTQNEKQRTPLELFMSGLLRIIGIGMPVGLILIMMFYPDITKSLGIENRVISLIALAWFFLAIDANLKLGVFDRIVTAAKAIREL